MSQTKAELINAKGGADLGGLNIDGSAPDNSVNLDSSGRLLVGTSSSIGNNDSVQVFSEGGNGLTVARGANNTGGTTINIVKSRNTTPGGTAQVLNNDSLGSLFWRGDDGNDYQSIAASIAAEVDDTPGSNVMPGRLVFSTANNASPSVMRERMRIDSAGGISTAGLTTAPSASNFGTYIGRVSAGRFETFYNTTSGGTVAQIGGTQGYAIVRGDGDLENTNNRYTALSDIKLKQNVEDASSQWSDIKAIQVRKYELIAHPERKHIGVIAQELEQVCPGLVIERIQDEETGETVKSVAYSVLYMKAVKALQEAMERIETLEASNTDLLARVSALESA